MKWLPAFRDGDPRATVWSLPKRGHDDVRRMGTARGVLRRILRGREAGERELFAVLQVQMRLSALTLSLHRIETDPELYGRQHHLLTTLGAYDRLLAEACTMAGLEIDAEEPDDVEAVRMQRELALCANGWTW